VSEGLTALAPAEVLAAVERAGRDNPLLGFAGGTGRPAEPLGAGDRPAEPLCAGDRPAVTRLLDEVGAWLGRPEPRVVASMVVLGYAARLVGPAVATVLRDGVLVDLRPSRVGYSFHPGQGFRLTLTEPAGWQGPPEALWSRWYAQVIDEHLRGLIGAVRAVVPVAAGLLWGNVAANLAGALRALAQAGTVPVERCHTEGLRLLDHGPLRGSGRLSLDSGRLGFVRTSCCLYYRLDGGGLCADCCLVPGRVTTRGSR
jgi:ferric iron reductase protein FhuF